MRRRLAKRKGTSDEPVVSADRDIGALDIRRRRDAALDLGFSLATALVWSPDQVACYLFVLCVGVEDRVAIMRRDRS
jgi:hypothetical protein